MKLPRHQFRDSFLLYRIRMYNDGVPLIMIYSKIEDPEDSIRLVHLPQLKKMEFELC